MTSIPSAAPLSGGLDAGQFQRHYSEAFQNIKRRAGQNIFNVWYFYVAPAFLGMLPGELLAKHFLDWQEQPEVYGLCLFGGALLITPLLMRYRRIHKSHKRYQFFYNAALEACLKQDNRREQVIPPFNYSSISADSLRR